MQPQRNEGRLISISVPLDFIPERPLAAATSIALAVSVLYVRVSGFTNILALYIEHEHSTEKLQVSENCQLLVEKASACVFLHDYQLVKSKTFLVIFCRWIGMGWSSCGYLLMQMITINS